MGQCSDSTSDWSLRMALAQHIAATRWRSLRINHVQQRVCGWKYRYLVLQYCMVIYIHIKTTECVNYIPLHSAWNYSDYYHSSGSSSLCFPSPVSLGASSNPYISPTVSPAAPMDVVGGSGYDAQPLPREGRHRSLTGRHHGCVLART